MTSHPLLTAILICWRRNGAYALRLVGDLSDHDFVAQPHFRGGPVPANLMNHPAWVLCHLNAYAGICAAMLRRQSFADPADHPYGAKSTVRSDAAAYPAPSAIVAEYRRLHDDAERALLEADAAVVGEPTPLERWRANQPTIGDQLMTLMVKHESQHLGQLSAWRRAMGLPPVAM